VRGREYDEDEDEDEDEDYDEDWNSLLILIFILILIRDLPSLKHAPPCRLFRTPRQRHPRLAQNLVENRLR